MSRRRKLLIGIGGALLAAIVAALLLGSGGSWETYPAPRRISPSTVAGAPAWTRPCWVGGHDGKRVRVLQCARLRGRVLWVVNEKVEHGGDAHIVVVESLHVRFAKMNLADRRRIGVPGIGHRVTLVGPIVRGAHVEQQLWAWKVEDQGL